MKPFPLFQEPPDYYEIARVKVSARFASLHWSVKPFYLPIAGVALFWANLKDSVVNNP